MGCAGKGPVMPGCLANAGKGGTPPFIPGKGFVGMPPMLGKGPCFIPGKGWMPGPGGAPNAAAQAAAIAAAQQAAQKKRSWSPHAGSRAIRECYKVDGGAEPDAVSEGAKTEKSSVKSKRSSSSSRGASS